MMLPKLRMLQMKSIVSICPRVRPIEAGPLGADLVLGLCILWSAVAELFFQWIGEEDIEAMIRHG